MGQTRRARSFCDKINQVKVDIKTWKKQKAILENKENEKDLFKLGFATFFLNRTNYSGFIDGGMIGGILQESEYKIDCRFNRPELIKRIKFIVLHKKTIHLKNLDALELVRKTKKDKNTIFYFDPPYYLKGPSLYMNFYQHDDHVKVSEEIKKIKNAKWIVSYDNTQEIKKMYRALPKKEYQFFHTAYSSRLGKEILFFSRNVQLPRVIVPTSTSS